ncbi:MAG: ribonuclease P protein component [Clostridia bacterium]|nr:ribonuclease P protein component [Clostridia bacterium]
MDLRLKKEKDFSLVFKSGKRLFSKSLTLITLKSKEIKAGFVVGKKHGGSVKRNKIKRLLRESFRSFVPNLNQNFFFVFIPKQENEYSLENFKKEMNYLFKKGKLFKNAEEDIY